MRWVILAAVLGTAIPLRVGAEEICTRPVAGSLVADPADLRSERGVLQVELTIRNSPQPDGSIRYCYLLPDGSQAPTLRLRPGELLILHLKNQLSEMGAPAPLHMHAPSPAGPQGDPCKSGRMSLTSTNLHFHGMPLAPRCHQDEVLKTSIQPHDAPFEYRFRVPVDAPPGLYWYHPHIHGFSKAQLIGGASGALIIEGLQRAEPAAAGLAERVLVIRDQDLLHPDAPPNSAEPVVPKLMIDRDGDAANDGTGFGKPAKDLSINFVPVPYPDYPPAQLLMHPGERQLWRVLNASAITYLNLALVSGHTPQKLGLVALDGVPLNWNGDPANAVEWSEHVGLPPGARAEFIVTAPPEGQQALFVTRTVDTGQGGENDPNRPLAAVVLHQHTLSATAPARVAAAAAAPLPAPARPWLGGVTPARLRHLYFSEKLTDPNDPNSATEFYITVEGETPAAFDPGASTPNITVHQGDVEDWIIENRSNELHAFHIHQTHFLLLDWSGTPVNEPFLRDTVNVPYYNGRMAHYPSVRLRMDFRDPTLIGTFLYHCHLLEHEDGGMMGTIRVVAAVAP